MNPASTEQSASTAPPLPLAAPGRDPVNLRSVLLGLFGVIAINAITPFNNHALANACLIRSYLPTGLLLFLMLFVLLINAPLHRFEIPVRQLVGGGRDDDAGSPRGDD